MIQADASHQQQYLPLSRRSQDVFTPEDVGEIGTFGAECGGILESFRPFLGRGNPGPLRDDFRERHFGFSYSQHLTASLSSFYPKPDYGILFTALQAEPEECTTENMSHTENHS